MVCVKENLTNDYQNPQATVFTLSVHHPVTPMTPSSTHLSSPHQAPSLASFCAPLTPTLRFLPASTTPLTKPADSDTVEATDRFGSVLTLRLVRRCINKQRSSWSSAASEVTGGRPENKSQAWNTTLAETATAAGRASAVAPSDDFAAGARLRGQEQASLEPGTPCFRPIGTCSR